VQLHLETGATEDVRAGCVDSWLSKLLTDGADELREQLLLLAGSCDMLGGEPHRPGTPAAYRWGSSERGSIRRMHTTMSS
jgi:hypothetical protein